MHHEGWDPTPDFEPLEEGDVACTSNDECEAPEQCMAPEQQCSDAAPSSTPLCPLGTQPTECSYCLKECGAGALPCDEGYVCDGGHCVSPLRCMLP